MAIYRTKEEERPIELQATPKKIERTIEVTHSPKEVHKRLSHNYRLNSENYAMNSHEANMICRISANRDKYVDGDLIRNFTVALTELSKKA